MRVHYYFIFFLLCTTSLFAQITIIHCGQFIDGVSKEVQSEISITIEGNQITAIDKGYIDPTAGTTLIDLKDKTVLPGLMDMHVHIEKEYNKKTYLERFTLNESDIAFRSVGYAKTTLMAGFTTIRDLGGTGVNVSLRKAIDGGLIEGPRIYAAEKSIAITGGHADPTNGYAKKLLNSCNPTNPKMGVADGADECRKAVRQRVKNGADCIKITATGGVLSVARDGHRPQFTENEIKAIVETANDFGITTAAHAHGAEGMKRAIRAGITSIEHGTLMDEETMELMKKHGTYYVPTITAGRAVADSAQIMGYYPKVVRPKALAIGPQIQSTFGKAYKAGVKIAFGTDAGVFAHGENAKEFGFMVEEGMPPMEAIQSATMEAAKLLRMEDKLGSLEKGKLADIIAVSGNPLDDIGILQTIDFVMKDGVVYKKK